MNDLTTSIDVCACVEPDTRATRILKRWAITLPQLSEFTFMSERVSDLSPANQERLLRHLLAEELERRNERLGI